MKTLKALNTLPNPSEEHKEFIDAGRDVKIKPIKRMLRDAISLSAAKNIEDAEEREQLKLKLMLIEDSIDLEDAQFKLLKTIVNDNPCGWAQHYYAQVASVIKTAEK